MVYRHSQDISKPLSDYASDPLSFNVDSLDEIHKAGTHLYEAISDPETGHSGEVTHTSFNRAFNTELPVWEWYETPEQEHRRKRFGLAMRGVAAFQPPDAILSGQGFNTLDAVNLC